MEVLDKIKVETYPAYKDSGVQWLGEMPDNWDIVTLGSILELKSDKNHPDYEVLSVYREYGVIQKSSREDNHNVTSDDTSNYKAVNPGDLVVNKMKAWQGSMGISEFKGIVSPAYITCKVSINKIHSPFLHLLLRSNLYIGEYNRISYGVRVGQWDMHYEDFKRVPILLPSKQEQIYIAQFLDSKIPKIERAITQKEKQIELLKERKQILMHKAVTRGLNPNVKLKDSSVNWFPNIPEHWEIKPLKHLGFVYAGITGKKGEDFSSENVDGMKPFIPFTNIFRYDIISKEEFQYVKIRDTEKQNRVLKYDLLFLMSSETLEDIGKCSIYLGQEKELYLNSFCKGYRITKENINPSFINYLLLSNSYRNYFAIVGRGFTRMNIKQEYVNNLPIIIPNKQEQDDIVSHIENIHSKISMAISLKEKEIEKLKEYKASLINAAVTGKIKVC